MARKTVHTGGCLCGAIRFEAEAPALKPHTCSCTMCQRHTGALTVAWVEFPKDAVRWTGPGGKPATYRSSEDSSRAFCPTCGSTLGAIDDDPVVALLVGAFDSANSKELIPTSHSYRSRRPKWWTVEITAG
ncbi:MAG: GFA family protein [Pseudomonadota bacterium]